VHPDRFIGLHFFSPVEKMPLLEIICGRDREETLARCLAFGARHRQDPIVVVNDGYGFYTSRVFGRT
jgi:3-hydroxyacyl-CoA dehydrogenase/enoyl-CoA hydratase/3-hydroxybutyryl-CoA epimerase